MASSHSLPQQNQEPMSTTPFNPLTATASDLQTQISTGQITSSSLANTYLERILRYNPYLHAVISTAPDARTHAARLDKEREAGHVRGPLHGIPILLKDNIATHPDLGMETTGGTFALAGSRPHRNAEIVERVGNGLDILIHAGVDESAAAQRRCDHLGKSKLDGSSP